MLAGGLAPARAPRRRLGPRSRVLEYVPRAAGCARTWRRASSPSRELRDLLRRVRGSRRSPANGASGRPRRRRFAPRCSSERTLARWATRRGRAGDRTGATPWKRTRRTRDAALLGATRRRRAADVFTASVIAVGGACRALAAPTRLSRGFRARPAGTATRLAPAIDSVVARGLGSARGPTSATAAEMAVGPGGSCWRPRRRPRSEPGSSRSRARRSSERARLLARIEARTRRRPVRRGSSPASRRDRHDGAVAVPRRPPRGSRGERASAPAFETTPPGVRSTKPAATRRRVRLPRRRVPPSTVRRRRRHRGVVLALVARDASSAVARGHARDPRAACCPEPIRRRARVPVRAESRRVALACRPALPSSRRPRRSRVDASRPPPRRPRLRLAQPPGSPGARAVEGGPPGVAVDPQRRLVSAAPTSRRRRRSRRRLARIPRRAEQALHEAPVHARELRGAREVAAGLLQHAPHVDALEALGPRLPGVLQRQVQRDQALHRRRERRAAARCGGAESRGLVDRIRARRSAR